MGISIEKKKLSEKKKKKKNLFFLFFLQSLCFLIYKKINREKKS